MLKNGYLHLKTYTGSKYKTLGRNVEECRSLAIKDFSDTKFKNHKEKVLLI